MRAHRCIAALGLGVAACAPAATPAIEHHVAVEPSPPVDHAAPVVPPGPVFYRHVNVGTHVPTAIRSIWALSIDGNSASLVETEQHAAGPISLEQADRAATWTTTNTHAEHGPVRHVGDHLALDLASDVDSLSLSCWRRSIEVEVAGARRVPRDGHLRDCDDPGTWSPATTTRVDALVCGQEDAGDDRDLETHWEFAAAPGVELVDVTDDCFQGEGLRLARER